MLVYWVSVFSNTREGEREREISDEAEFLKNLILACAPESYHLLRWKKKSVGGASLEGLGDGESKS